MDTLFGEFQSYPQNPILCSPPNQNLHINNGFIIDTPDFKSLPPEDSAPSPGGSSEGEYEGPSSSTIIKFIGEMLMEEESLEDKPCMLQDCLALQAAEKSLYDILGQDYPYPPQSHLPCLNQFQFQNFHSPEADSNSPSSSFSATNHSASSYSPSSSSFSATNQFGFQIGPNLNTLSASDLGVPFLGIIGSRKKNHQREEEDGIEDLQVRSNKQSAFCEEFDPQILDNILLCSGGDGAEESGAPKSNDKRSITNNNTNANGKSRRGKRNGGGAKKGGGGGGEVVDLWTLLTQCSQSVATNDQRTSNDLLNQIRQHSSPLGNGMQRTAHYLANALEARLAGAKTPAYLAPFSYKASAAEMLKAYQLYIKACPFKIMSNIPCTLR